MSKLATQLAATDVPTVRVRRGPANLCGPIYGAGDMDDWEAVEAMRAKGFTWREVQAQMDGLLNVERPITSDQFRYHWRRRCFCWPDGDRL